MVASNKLYAIVPAAGVGIRMQANIPKQYLALGNCTVIEQTLHILLNCCAICYIIVVLHPEDNLFFTLPLASDKRIKVAYGGKHRAESVWHGLQMINQGWVLIHDAVRPCLHPDDLDLLLTNSPNCVEGVILATPVRDTLKCSHENYNVAYSVPRAGLWHALTPQLFPVTLLKNCLRQVLLKKIEMTDDSSALEYCGYKPKLVHGRADNIKITYPQDLKLAANALTQIQQYRK